MIDETLFDAEDKMDKTVGVAKDEFAQIRTGQASTAMFARVTVEYYGAPTPLQQLASISIPEPRMILIAPFDMGAMKDIEAALRAGDMGFNPANDGNVLRINMPQLTEERRREYVKVAKTKAEDAKVTIRNIRRKAKDAIDTAIKDGKVGEDDGMRAEKELDVLTKKHVDAIDALLTHKENELLEV